MKLDREQYLLYGITDRGYLRGNTLEEAAEEALLGGVSILQLREKDLDESDLRSEAIALQALCRRYQVPFILDDNVALAVELDLDGVHVGQNDMPAMEARRIIGPDKILGVTAKTASQAQAAEAAGADYLGSGAMFGTHTKPDARPMSCETLKGIAGSVSIPVVAIGGITLKNVMELGGTGIAGVAVVGGLFGQPDIRQAAAALREAAKSL